MDSIPTGVYLTVYAGESDDFMQTPLSDLARQIEAGTLHLQVGKTFHLDEIVSAHRLFETLTYLIRLGGIQVRSETK